MLIEIYEWLNRKYYGANNFFSFDGYYYSNILGGSIGWDFWWGRLIEHKGTIYFLHSVKSEYVNEYRTKVKLYGIELSKSKHYSELIELHKNMMYKRRLHGENWAKQEYLWQQIST